MNTCTIRNITLPYNVITDVNNEHYKQAFTDYTQITIGMGLVKYLNTFAPQIPEEVVFKMVLFHEMAHSLYPKFNDAVRDKQIANVIADYFIQIQLLKEEFGVMVSNLYFELSRKQCVKEEPDSLDMKFFYYLHLSDTQELENPVLNNLFKVLKLQLVNYTRFS